jgi:hypothetical protein
MDPFTAIGFASSILSFIDFSSKVVTGAIEIYGSDSRNTNEGRSSEAIVVEMRRFVAKLQPPKDSKLTESEKALCKLAVECDSLAEQILSLLEKVKAKNRKSKGSSLVAAIKAKMYDGDRRRLEEHLNYCRAQLGLQLNDLTR